MDLDALKNDILSAGNRLNSDGINAGPELRKLQEVLSRYTTNNPEIQFLAFFVAVFIDDLYFNLSGDFPYESKSYALRNNIFVSIGTLLTQLAESLGHYTLKEGQILYNIYVDLVACYYKGLNDLDASITT
jgi:hypothetical protein